MLCAFEYMILMLFQLVFADNLFAQTPLLHKVHTDFITISNSKAIQDFYVELDSTTSVEITSRCYKIQEKSLDSQLVASASLRYDSLKAGLQILRINYKDSKSLGYIDTFFLRILKEFEIVPPGVYEFRIVCSIGSNTFFQKTIREYDSSLALISPLRKSINETILESAKSKIFDKGVSSKPIITERIEQRLNRKLKHSGIKRILEREDNRITYRFYYDTVFLGKYSLDNTPNVYSRIKEEVNRMKQGSSTLIKNDLENFESITHQFKKNNINGESTKLNGELGINANLSNSNEYLSVQDRNFYELNALFNTELLGIPIQIEAYLTTQDLNRRIKSSYLRFHYDVETAKSKLQKTLSKYQDEVKQAEFKAKDIEGKYNSHIKSLTGIQDGVMNDLIKETRIKSEDDKSKILTEFAKGNVLDTNYLFALMMKSVDSCKANSIDNDSMYKASKDSAYRCYQRCVRKYEEAQKIRERIERYQVLLSQYRTTSRYDSLITRNKLGDLNELNNMSYKDMARRGSALLPEGKVKNISTGLSNLDMGMFSKYTSKYTIGGQMLKGIDVGYDLRFATTNLTYGRTEYNGRDGVPEKYSCYSVSTALKPIFDQYFTLTYYGYSPSNALLRSNNEFFKNLETDYPTFRRPTHIVSLNYQGEIYKKISAKAEVATSIQPERFNSRRSVLSHDNLAYTLGLEGEVPITKAIVEMNYEHNGVHFENNTIPLALSGTNIFRISAKRTLFKELVSIGLEYNYLVQHNISGKSKNNRWGFEMKTQSKQYPNVAFTYKPFSTFRSLSDTLGIPQRPILGEVWIAKANYQFRKHANVYRIMLLYNRNVSNQDTSNYENGLLQLSVFYANKEWMLNMSLSRMNQFSNVQLNSPDWQIANAYVVSGNATRNVSQQLSVQGGGDLALSKFGLANLGLNGGFTCRLKNKPIQYQCNIRYNRFRMDENIENQHRIAALIGMNWRFGKRN